MISLKVIHRSRDLYGDSPHSALGRKGRYLLPPFKTSWSCGIPEVQDMRPLDFSRHGDCSKSHLKAAGGNSDVLIQEIWLQWK